MELLYKPKTHENNFDFLRLLFAIFVIITHSYSLSGIAENDLLNQITNAQTSLSYIGVRGFFIISGYLIFQSLLRSSNLGNYFWKRILRLFPALTVVLLITICLGPLVYNRDFHSYLSNDSMWTYFPNNFSLYNLQFGITGVLDNKAINGSLWTIRYEFSLYIILSFFFLFRNKKDLLPSVLITVFLLLMLGKFFLFGELGSIGKALSNSMSLNLGLFFFGGALLASLRIEGLSYKWKLILNILSTILLCISIYFKVFNTVQFIFLPVIVILVGTFSTKYINSFSQRFGDISYGIYIYSFPIQQVLVYFFGLDYLYLMGTSLIISIIFGFLSWHLIEKKALRFKKIKNQ